MITNMTIGWLICVFDRTLGYHKPMISRYNDNPFFYSKTACQSVKHKLEMDSEYKDDLYTIAIVKKIVS